MIVKIIDRNLIWKRDMKLVTEKRSKNVGFITQLSYIARKNTQYNICLYLLIPYSFYHMVSWENETKTYLNPILVGKNSLFGWCILITIQLTQSLTFLSFKILLYFSHTSYLLLSLWTTWLIIFHIIIIKGCRFFDFPSLSPFLSFFFFFLFFSFFSSFLSFFLSCHP